MYRLALGCFNTILHETSLKSELITQKMLISRKHFDMFICSAGNDRAGTAAVFELLLLG